MRAPSALLPLALLFIVACATPTLAKRPHLQPMRDAAHASHQHEIKQAQSIQHQPSANSASVARDLNADKDVLARFSKFVVDKTSGDSAEEIVGASAASLYGSVGCSVCQAIAAPLSRALLSNASLNIITPIAEALCELKHPQCNDVKSCKDLCSQIVPEFAYEVVEIATETVLSPPYLCYLLKMCPAPPPPPPPTHFVPVPSNCSNHAGEQDWPSWKNTTGTGYFVQLSDIHVDLKYTVGAQTQCGEPLCCRSFDGPGHNSSDSAGLWGDYNCDLPINTFETLLSHIAELKPAPDFILYTGDDPPHDVWEQSRDWNLQAINELHALFTKYFPDIPVFSALGNHESFPVNQYEGPGGDSWLYDTVAHNWGSWLCEDAIPTIRYAGYYTCRVRPGLRVISMNTNMWVSGNYWLLVNRTDAISHQFDWIADVLKQARALNEKVIFIGHAVSSDWYDDFALQFVQIVDEYRDVIADQFYGHSHTSSLQLFYDNATGTIPISTGYIVGSLTPYTDLNPGWRLYSYDRDALARATAPLTPPVAIKRAKPKSGSIRLNDDEDIVTASESLPSFDKRDDQHYTLVTDFAQYWLDLPEANRLNTTDWSSHFYIATAAYNLTSPLTAAQWDEFADDLITNPALYNAFSYNYYRGGPQAPESAQELSCEIQGPTTAAYNKCMQGHGLKGTFKVRPRNQC